MASIGIYCAYIYHGNSPKVCVFFIIHWVPAYTHSEDHLPTINYELQAVKLQGCISWGPQPLQDASHHQDVTFLWLTDCGLNPLLATVKSGGKHPCINIYIYIFIFKYMYIYIYVYHLYILGPWSNAHWYISWSTTEQKWYERICRKISTHKISKMIKQALLYFGVSCFFPGTATEVNQR